MEKITLYELYKKYPIVGNTCEGFTSVGIKDQFFHVDEEKGEPAYEERFDWVEDFHDGSALVEKDGKSFHIYPNGKRFSEEEEKKIEEGR